MVLSPPPLFSEVFCSVALSPPACLSLPPLFSVVLSPPLLFSVVSVSVVERSVLSTVKVWWETVVTVWLVAVSLWWEPVRTRTYSPSGASAGAGRLPVRLPLASTVSSPRV